MVGAVPSIGFIHRGLEKLVEKRDFKQYVYIAERVCGICSCGHGLGYCEAVEQVMGIEVPDRARYLRTIWVEMSRVHSHLLWLGFDETTGGRIIHSVNCVGGVQKDMDSTMLQHILQAIDDIRSEMKPVVETFMQDYTVQSRLKGSGILTKEDATALGAAGPVLRASGISYDARRLGYAAYGDLTMEPITAAEGDSYARCKVRLKELFQSFDLIREAIGKIPDGPISVPVKGNPSGEFFMRIEQPRGEAIYYVKGSGTKYLDRFRMRTPTTSNIPALVEMLKGCQLADVPLLILTIDPCVSCTER